MTEFMNRQEFNANKKYLLEDCNNIFWNGQAWDEEPFSVELESYTKAGGDMVFNLEVCDKKHLQEYIDDFNINYEVVSWWQDGKKGNGVPFDNIKEHYDDCEDWLKWLQTICDKMPY
jgi:hypothetical protein